MHSSQENPLEKEMATHPSILAGKFHGQRSLVGYSPWCHKTVRHNLATKQQWWLWTVRVYCGYTNRRMDKKDVVYINTMKYYSVIKKEWNNVICNNMDVPKNYHIKWSKSERETQMPYNIIYM